MRISSLAGFLALACASSPGLKGGPVFAFAPEGITDKPPQRHALLVGIDHFEDPRFNDLRFAAADARALGTALSDFEDVRELVRPEETRRAGILEALADLERRIRNPRDTVLLYFSTHGSLAQRPGAGLERELVAADTRLDLLRETGLSVDELIHRAERLPSHRVALILATCHSGRGKSRVPDLLAQALAAHKAPLPKLEDVSEAVVVLSAAGFGDAAREDEKLGHDVYTYFFIEALAAGDRDGDGAVTISEAHDYARERTWQFTQGEQRPAAESTILGLDPIVLHGQRQRDGMPVIFSYERSAEGVAVRLSGQPKGVLPGGFAVPAGRQKLELADSGTGALLYSGNIQLNAGDRIELSRLIKPAPRIEIAVEGGLFIPLSHAARNVLPVAPAGGLRVRARNWPASPLAVEFGIAAFGATAATTPDQANSVTGLHVQAALVRPFDLGHGAVLEPLLGLGNLWVSRTFHVFSAHDSLRALTLTPGIQFAVSPSHAVRAGMRFETSIFSGQLEGPRSLHAAGQLALQVAYSF